MKNLLPSSSLPFILEEWIDDKSHLCVYTPMQLVKFPRVHLVVGGWYLDCSRGFVPDVEEILYNNNLASSAPEVFQLEEEPPKNDNPAPPTNDKDVAPVKAKGKGKRVFSCQMSTCSFSKASV